MANDKGGKEYGIFTYRCPYCTKIIERRLPSKPLLKNCQVYCDCGNGLPKRDYEGMRGA